MRIYQDNKLNGEAIDWFDTGQKFSEGGYKDGKPDGQWTWWNNKGMKTEERDYLYGNLLSKKIFKYSFLTGDLKSQKTYINDKCVSNC